MFILNNLFTLLLNEYVCMIQKQCNHLSVTYLTQTMLACEIYKFLSKYVYIYLSLFISIYLYLSLSICIYVCACYHSQRGLRTLCKSEHYATCMHKDKCWLHAQRAAQAHRVASQLALRRSLVIRPWAIYRAMMRCERHPRIVVQWVSHSSWENNITQQRAAHASASHACAAAPRAAAAGHVLTTTDKLRSLATRHRISYIC